MGIVNLTPDSFSGDGLAHDVGQSVRYAHQQIEAGADLLDLGAESTRPGAAQVSAADELTRLVPVLRALRSLGIPISVDTSKPEVMQVALDEGAAIINDIRALQTSGARQVVASSDCAVCLMHMQGSPESMQTAPHYDDVVSEVMLFLQAQLVHAEASGILRQRCWIDPGFGFGKTLEHNLALFRALPRFAALGVPLLIGVSRKSMLGEITGRAVQHRLAGSVAAAVMAAGMGAAVLRVHDVAATLDGLKTWRALTPATVGVRG